MKTKRMCFFCLVYLVSGCGGSTEQGEDKAGHYELNNNSGWDLVVRYEIGGFTGLAFSPEGETTKIHTLGEARRPEALLPFEVFDSFSIYRVQNPSATQVLSEIPLNWQVSDDSALTTRFTFSIAEDDFVNPTRPTRPNDFYDAGQNYDFYVINASSQDISMEFQFRVEEETISYLIPFGESVYLGSHETPGYQYSASGMFDAFALFTEQGELKLSRNPVADLEWTTYQSSVSWSNDYYDSVLVVTDEYIDGI